MNAVHCLVFKLLLHCWQACGAVERYSLSLILLYSTFLTTEAFANVPFLCIKLLAIDLYTVYILYIIVNIYMCIYIYTYIYLPSFPPLPSNPFSKGPFCLACINILRASASCTLGTSWRLRPSCCDSCVFCSCRLEEPQLELNELNELNASRLLTCW